MFGQRYQTLGSAAPETRSWGWLYPCLGFALTTVVAVALVALNAQDWRSSESTALWVLGARSTIAIAVQIISHILGWIQVQSLCNVIEFSFRVALPRRSSSLEKIRFFEAVSRPNVAWHARWPLKLASVLFVGISIIPGALWSGAITPLIAEQHTTRTLKIPTFESKNVSGIFQAGNTTGARIAGFGSSPVWMTNNGLFTFDLTISSIRGTFVGYASSASNSTQPGSLIPKFDETSYHYLNRSYGVGASAGLIDIPDTERPQWYTFRETGFNSVVKCTRNDTSTMAINYIIKNDPDAFQQFQATGTYANGANVSILYPQVCPQRQDIFMWSMGYDKEERRSMLSIAVDVDTPNKVDDWQFHQFHNVQCDVKYNMKTFLVEVNTTAKTIEVSKEGDVDWPDYGDVVVQALNTPISRFSADESMVFGSQLGHSIVLNINQLQKIKKDNSTDTMFQGLEDFLASLVDNSLGMLSATRLIGANETVSVDATVGLPAVTYGKEIYIYAVLAFNILLLLIFIEEAIRTRLWASMADLELSDAAMIIVSGSEGGTAVAERARGMSKEQIGDIRVRLCNMKGSSREAIIPHNMSSHVELGKVDSRPPDF